MRSQPERRRAILVAGMHRSGTSALTGILGHLGAELPRNQMLATPANAAGYFESQAIVDAHDALLAELGSRWDDVATPGAGALAGHPKADAWVEKLTRILRSEYEGAPLFALKDPRLCRLLPLWDSVFARTKVEPCFIVTVRNPLEVAASLRDQHGTPLNRALLMWLDHLLSAEFATRRRTRAFVSYDSVLDDWLPVMEDVGKALDIEWPNSPRSVVEDVRDFLSTKLRHHREPEPLEERSDVHRWVQRAYAWALEAAAGDAPSSRSLDGIRRELRTAQETFGQLLISEEMARADAMKIVRDSRAREEADARRLETAQRELDLARSEAQRFEDRFAEIATQAARRAEAIAAFESERDRFTADLAAQRAQIEQRDQRQAELQLRIEEQRTRIEEQSAAIAEQGARLQEQGALSNRCANLERELGENKVANERLQLELRSERTSIATERKRLALESKRFALHEAGFARDKQRFLEQEEQWERARARSEQQFSQRLRSAEDRARKALESLDAERASWQDQAEAARVRSEEERASWEDERQLSRARFDAQVARAAEVSAKLARAEAEIDAAGLEVAELERKLQRGAADLVDRNLGIAILKNQIDTYRNSRSWRMTRFARRVGSIFRTILGS